MPRFNLDDYITVQERLNQFWHDHPQGRILTMLVSDPADFTTCRYRAEVYRDAEDDRPAATGYAVEHAGGQGANATSHEENSETSSIGRALANLGYATSQRDRPSREEMRKVAALGGDERPAYEVTPRPNAPAMRQDARPTEKQIKFLHKLAADAGLSHDGLSSLCEERYGGGVGNLTKTQASALIEAFQQGTWGQNVDRETGEILPPASSEGFVPEPRDEVLASLREVSDRRDLAAIKVEIRELHLHEDEVVTEAYRKAFERLQQPAMV
jgi:hypothetical protein